MDTTRREHQRLRIAISGASGLIGSRLSEVLTSKGHKVIRLVRQRTHNQDDVYWDPEAKHVELQGLENVDVVINLSGKNIAQEKWTPSVKTALKESRLKSTALLASTLSKLRSPPRLFLSASAIGYYGNKDDQIVDETAEPGTGFLSQLTREWELSTWAAEAIGTQVNHLRFGIVLDKNGGALQKMLTPMRFGLGATFGDGNQYMSWITLEDLVSAILFIIENPHPNGPINIVAPNPVTNREFMETLGSVIHRPVWFTLSEKMIGRLFGEMGRPLFLDSTRVSPDKLLKAGFIFESADLREALALILKK